MKKETKTESVSVRIEKDLKTEFFDLLDKQQKSFSKWLRAMMKKELDKK